ncbi:LysR family transcriptional regulator [Roseinatronobacter alkalisoli]|uniref:LysR family transcriptional regulator n=1 Tax=Roseinatronobacter alkalisoli TaxID=3028235 RepID=A0ABT5T794_9RHOB|nr:LysR family transcriptional regulator [Roseinatronobacter sp. HJB301]MDD7970836.1 LysR family transcriptional regulator [Roseinatronobacter sp. HJB301]
MNARLDWGDFATLLLIADARTLAAAARRTTQSRPTLMRRLNQIEQRLGARVFERLRTGYVPTAAGRELIDAGREMQSLATEAERRVGDRDKRPAGKVVLTTTDTLFTALVAPELSGFYAAFPGIVLDVHVSNLVQNLTHREADVALRPASSPEDRLVGRKLGVIRQAIFVHRSLAEQPLDALPAVGPADDFPYPALHVAMRSTGLLRNCTVQVNSILSMHQTVRHWGGAGILPVYLGGNDPDLLQIGDPIAALDTDLWLLTDPDLRNTARIRAVLDHFGSSSALRARLQ